MTTPGPIFNPNDTLRGAESLEHLNRDQFMPPNEIGPNFQGPEDMRAILRTRQVYQGDSRGYGRKAGGTYDAPPLVNTPKKP